MSRFKIPHGKTYTFTITVLERNSFLPKDLATMNTGTSSFSLVKLDDLTVVPGVITIVRVPDSKVNVLDPDTYLQGLVSVSIPNTVTATLAYERGGKIDGYYIKPTYQGVITVKFTDATSDIVAVIPEICVVPTGV